MAQLALAAAVGWLAQPGLQPASKQAEMAGYCPHQCNHNQRNGVCQ